MAVKLHLGVIDVPYVQAPSPRQRKPRAATVTTGDVAGWLENKYHIMEIFAQEHAQDIARDLETSIAGSFESLLMGAPLDLDAFGAATSKIEDRMKQFVMSGEMDRLGFPGVPTKAAQLRAAGRRRGARFKTARATGTGDVAVSFYDSGLYESSMKAWVQ